MDQLTPRRQALIEFAIRHGARPIPLEILERSPVRAKIFAAAALPALEFAGISWDQFLSPDENYHLGLARQHVFAEVYNNTRLLKRDVARIAGVDLALVEQAVNTADDVKKYLAANRIQA